MSELLTVPNVAVTALLVCTELRGATPPNAHPSDPLPGGLTPGIPAPPYAVLMSIQPLAPDVESMVLPGNATHSHAMLPDQLTSNLETDVLIILNVKYCVPERPALKLGPAGK